MKKLLLWGLMAFCSGCFRHQHEERIANGDTGITPVEKPVIADSNAIRKKLAATAEAKLLFDSKCITCHQNTGTCRVLTGVKDRIPEGEWKYHWFRNPDSVVAAGEPYANAIRARWNNLPHPAFPELSRYEIDQLLQYISEW